MGADFMFGAAEMPDVQRVDGQIGVLAAERIFVKLSEALENDDVVSEVADHLDILDNPDFDGDVKVTVYERLRNDLLGFWNGEWERSYAPLITYDKDGNEIVLTCSGEMSWGDISEPIEILWRFSMLPEGWWK